jgi:glycosyltransferase involved in cell wall biosynthesis
MINRPSFFGQNFRGARRSADLSQLIFTCIAARSALFPAIYDHLTTLASDPSLDVQMLSDTAQKIEHETIKGERADVSQLRKWVGTLERLAPSVFDLILALPPHTVQADAAHPAIKLHQQIQTSAKENAARPRDQPPSASVVLAVKDGERTISQSVQSILDQTCTDLELIVVDDGSRDETPDILATFARQDPRVRIVTHPVNIGIPGSRNHAIALSRGKYVICCDADDWSAPTRIERQVSLLDRRLDIGLVLSRVQRVDRHGFPIEETGEYDHVEPYWSGDLFRIKLSGSCPIHGGEAAIRRSLLEAIGGYRPQFSLAEDYDLWLRLSMICDFMMIDDTLYFRREYPEQTSRRLTALHTQLAFLARECHYIRLNGGDDLPYLNAESDRLHKKFGRMLMNERLLST